MRSTPAMIAFAALVALASSGCQTMKPDWGKLWWGGPPSPPKLQESKYPTPIKIAIIWSPAVLNQVGESSTRGFGGRIYFYDAKNRPVPVEGQLVVYAYNDDQPGNENRPPERKFAFTPEQFTTHYSPTELGASYSIWIPWDRIGSSQAQISLIPIFTASSGQLVIGETSHNLLPGPSAPPSETQYNRMMLPPSPVVRADPAALQRSEYAVEQASFQQNLPLEATSQATGGLNTMSITLPSSMADQLAGAPPQIGPLERLALQRAALASARLATAGAPSTATIPTTPTAPKPATSGAAPPPWMSVVPPPVRYGPPSPQAPIAPAPQPTGGPPRSALFPSGQPSAPPATR
jgi:hypothetical protein